MCNRILNKFNGLYNSSAFGFLLHVLTDFSVHSKNLSNLLTEVSKQRYKDSNLEMTESESVALPFGDSALLMNNVPCSVARYSVYTMFLKNASTFLNFHKIISVIFLPSVGTRLPPESPASPPHR